MCLPAQAADLYHIEIKRRKYRLVYGDHVQSARTDLLYRNEPRPGEPRSRYFDHVALLPNGKA
jgi:hypothetical protein